MMRNALYECLLAGLLLAGPIAAFSEESGGPSQVELAGRFTEWEALDWKTTFAPSASSDWRDHWFLDGALGRVESIDGGFEFHAGPNVGDNASHAVLWTRPSFDGDARIDYEFTRLDERTRHVNIIYIQATGYGEQGYGEDILSWADKRRVPAMSMYYKYMNTYHISYAAFENDNDDPFEDYIRARRYLPLLESSLRGTDLKPDNFRTGLFETGIAHRITILKVGQTLLMRASNDEKTFYCQWVNEDLAPIDKGRIGLRHMWTRASRYRDFNVSAR